MGPLGSIIAGELDPQHGVGNGASSGTESTSSGTESVESGASSTERIAGYSAITPSYPISGTETGGPKKRGRPRGSRNRTTTDTSGTGYTQETGKNLATSSIADLEALLLSIHLMGAKLLSCPELELDDAEAKKLSDSIKNVAKYYPVVISAKKIALFDLGATLTGIYGTRVIAIMAGRGKGRVASSSGPVAVPSPAPKTDTPKQPEKNHALNPHEVYPEGSSGGENY